MLTKWAKNDEVWTVMLCFTFCIRELITVMSALWLKKERRREGSRVGGGGERQIERGRERQTDRPSDLFDTKG